MHPAILRLVVPLACAVGACVCGVGAGYAAIEATDQPAPPSRRTSFTYIERLTGGAGPSERLPLVLALHGMDDTPRRAFERMYAGFPMKARFLLPRGRIPHGGGFAWFAFLGGKEVGPAAARQIAGEADRIDRLAMRVAAAHHATRVIAVGFSQGAMLAYTLGVRHADHYAAVFPLSGFLPPSLVPERCTDASSIFATHGDADSTVPLGWDERSVAALVAARCRTVLRIEHGLGHSVSPAQIATLYTGMRSALAD